MGDDGLPISWGGGKPPICGPRPSGRRIRPGPRPAGAFGFGWWRRTTPMKSANSSTDSSRLFQCSQGHPFRSA